jgi:hypothetical protein
MQLDLSEEFKLPFVNEQIQQTAILAKTTHIGDISGPVDTKQVYRLLQVPENFDCMPSSF